MAFRNGCGNLIYSAWQGLIYSAWQGLIYSAWQGLIYSARQGLRVTIRCGCAGWPGPPLFAYAFTLSVLQTKTDTFVNSRSRWVSPGSTLLFILFMIFYFHLCLQQWMSPSQSWMSPLQKLRAERVTDLFFHGIAHLNASIIWDVIQRGYQYLKANQYTFRGSNSIKIAFFPFLKRSLLYMERICSPWKQILSF